MELLDLVNEVRQNPSYLIPYLEEMIPKFEGRYYYPDDPSYYLYTSEGALAVEEAIEAL